MSLHNSFDRTKHLDELDEPLDTQEGVLTPAQRRARVVANLGITATAAELNYLDLTTIGVAEASKALVLDEDGALSWAFSSASTDGGTSVEGLAFTTTMTGAGGVGGRAAFRMNTEVELGSWANALKAEVDWGDAGAVTGLGSAFVAEMTLGPGSEAGGTYGVLELELNAPADSGASNVAFIYASMQGADVATLDDAVSFASINGVAAGAGSIFNTFTQITNAAVQASLKIKINGTEWFIPLMDTQVGT